MLTGAGLIAMGLVGTVYGLRLQIGAALARRYLSTQGVESEIAIQSLSLHGFSGRLRLGPPGRPDATADRIDVDLTISPPWGPRPLEVVARRIRLVRPTLTAELDRTGLHLGQLQRLIGAAKPGASAAETPDLSIADGRLTLITPVGVLQMRGSGALKSGRPVSLDLHVAPAQLVGDGWSVETGEGAATLGPSASGIAAKAQAPIIKAHWPGTAITGAVANLVFIGQLSDPGRPLMLLGRAQAQLNVAAAKTAGRSIEATSAKLDLSSFELAMAKTDISLTGSGDLDAATPKLDLNGVAMTGVSATVRKLQFQAALDQGHWRATSTANLRAQVRQAQVRAGAVALRLLDPAWAGEGRLNLAQGRLVAALTGGVTARGGLTPADAARLTPGLDRVAGAEAQLRTLRAALLDFRLGAPALRFNIAPGHLRLGLSAPIRLSAANGVHLTLSPASALTQMELPQGRIEGGSVIDAGGADLPSAEIRLDRARFAQGVFDGRIAARIAGSAGPLHRATLSGTGEVHGGAGRLGFSPSGCLALAADQLSLGGDDLLAPAGRLCADPARPLFTADATGWRADGRFEHAGLASRLYSVRVQDLDGAFTASGLRAHPVEAMIHLEPALVTDEAAPKRFAPVRAGGDVRLERARIQARLGLATAKGEALGTVSLLDDMDRGDGSAVIDSSPLRFVRGGLQPLDLSPLAAGLRSVQGLARFKGQIAWARSATPTSSGELSVDGLDMASPAGAVTGLRADVHFTSLTPLTTAPGQVLTVRSIDAPVPLHDLRLVFALEPEDLQIQSAQLNAADGVVRLEPLRLALTGGRPSDGVLAVSGLDLGKLVAASSLADKIRLEAVVDGRLPFQIGPNGLTLLQGRLAAVRPGRLSIQHELLTGSSHPNAVQDFAYQALGDLAFDVLDATMESRPAGRLGVLFHIKGRYDPAVGREAYVGVKQLIDGTAFQKSIPLPKGTPINLTLDTSLNFNQLLTDYQNAFDFGRVAAPADFGRVAAPADFRRVAAPPADHSGAVQP